MLTVVVEVEIQEIREYFSLEKTGDLPIAGTFLKEHLDSELKYHNIDNYTIVNQRDLKILLQNTTENYVLLLLSNAYYEFSKSFSYHLKNQREVRFINKFNECIGGVFFKDKLVDISDVYSFLLNVECSENDVTAYSKLIKNHNDYKELLKDILNEKTQYKLPEIAQGIFASHSVPKGDYTIIPPVFIDENVQIENGSIIGPDTLIFDNSLIGENSVVRGSVLWKKTYISSDCYIDDSVLCENVSVCKGSAVFSGCLIGGQAIINENIFIENNTKIKPYLRLKNEMFSKKKYSEKSLLESYLTNINPQNTAVLGQALGILSSGEKVAVLCSGGDACASLKSALVSGLLFSGTDCMDFGCFFESSLCYFTDFCEINYSVFIYENSGKAGVNIYHKNELLSQTERLILNSLIKEKIYESQIGGKFGELRQIHGMNRMYLQHCVNLFTDELTVKPFFEASDNIIQHFCTFVTSKLNFNEQYESCYFQINESGNALSAVYKNQNISNKDILRMVSYYFNKSRHIPNHEIWRYDAVYLSFAFLKILNDYNGNLERILNETPDFYVVKSFKGKAIPFKQLSEKFNTNQVKLCKDGVVIKKNNTTAQMIMSNNNKVKISVFGADMEAAQELAVEIGGLFSE